MDQQNKPILPANDQPVTSVKTLLVHLTWLVFGPIALFVTIYSIINSGTGWFSLSDFAFLLVAVLMIIVRWVDQKSGQCTTSEGKPSTWKDFQQYAVLLSAFAVGAWLVVKAIRYWFMASKTIV
jgi:hypothetical protein